MTETGFTILKIPKEGGAYAFGLEARSHAINSTGVGGYLNAKAVASGWYDVEFATIVGAGVTIPVSIGASAIAAANLFSGSATVIGGSTPNGDLRSEADGYLGIGNTTPYNFLKGQEYSGAFVAVYKGNPSIANSDETGKIGIGTSSTEITTSGYYEGPFTTREIYEFQPSFTVDSTDLTKIPTGSGVYTDIPTLQFNILNRNGQALTSAAQIAADPFVKEQRISILNTDGTVVFPNYRVGGDSTFTLTRSQNIDVFGTYTRNFGIRNEVVNEDGGVHTSEFYLYANTVTFDKIFVRSSGETVLNENYTNHSPPNTGGITTAENRANAIKYFNNQPVNESGTTGFIEADIGFNEDSSYVALGDVTIWQGATKDFVTNRSSLVGNYPLNSIQQGQKIRLTANDGVPEGTPLFFKLAVDSEVGFNEEIFTIGPITLEPEVEGPDLNLYNQGDQTLVGDFTIEAGLEGDAEDGGNLNVSGNALGTGEAGRLTGPTGIPYLLSGDAAGGGGSDTLQDVVDRGNATTTDINFNGSKIIFNGDSDKSIGYSTDSPEGLLLGADVESIKSAHSNTFVLFPDQAVAIGASATIIGASPATGSAVLGGTGNTISGHFNTLVGGAQNKISGDLFGFNFIGGGSGVDITNSQWSSSVGGYNNDVLSTDFAILAGGHGNLISGAGGAFLGGGFNNKIFGSSSVICGGQSSTIQGPSAKGFNFIGAGASHVISGQNNSILGGGNHEVVGDNSCVLGGTFNIISGDRSIAGGRKIEITHDGATVLSDGRNVTHSSSGDNSATFDFAGGVYVPSTGFFNNLHVSGVPVLTGENNPAEADTLQTVTTRGNETTTSIVSTGPHVSGVTGLFGDKVGIGTNSPLAMLHAEGTMQVKGAAGWAGLDTQGGAIYMSDVGRGLLGNMGSNYARPLISTSSQTIIIGSNGTSAIRNIKYNAGNGAGTADSEHNFYTSGNNVRLHIAKDGKVGIGTDNPTETLEVTGDIFINGGPAGGRSLALKRTGATNPWKLVQGHTQTDYLEILEGSDTRFLIKNGGNVGIGTNDPETTLELATTMSSSPTTQLYLDVDGSNSVGGGGELIISTSASAGAKDAFNAIVRGERSSLNDGSSDLTFLTTHVPTSATAAARMTIKDDGLVGIGTTDPDEKLEVYSGHLKVQSSPVGGVTPPSLKIGQVNNAYQAGLISSTHVTLKSTNGAGNIYFQPGNTYRGIVQNDGKMGVNTTTPNSTLHVEGDITGAGDVLGTGAGNRITNNGTPYLLSGDSPAENDTLQDVTTRGNTTTTSILSTGPHISGISGLFGDRVGIGLNSPEDFNSEGNRLVIGDGVGAEGLTIFSGPSHSASVLFADGTGGNSSYEGFIQYRHGDEGFRIGAGGGAKMFIGANNTVGIGTLAPNAELEIASSVPTLRLTDSDLTNHYSDIEKAGVYTYLYSRANASNGGFIFLGTAGSTDTEFMRIDTDGDVGIGSNTPSAKLDVAGGIKLLDNNYLTWNSSNTRIVGNSSYLQFQVGASDKVRIQSDGHVGIGTTTAPSELTVFSTDSNSATASVHCINNNETGALLRLIEGDNHQGGFLQYDGSANKFNIGVHSTNDTTFANDTKAITIDRDTAHVGIGTTNPSHTLDVESADETVASFNSTDNKCAIALNDDDTTVYVSAENSRGALGFQAGLHADNLNIDTAGNVGIGTHTATVPGGTAKLSLQASSVPLSWGVSSTQFVYHRTLSANKFQIQTHYGGNVGELLLNSYGENDTPVGIGTTDCMPNVKLHVEGVVSGSNSFLGTGVGNRITNNHVPYLLSGDAAAALTLQDVCDNGNTTTTSIGIGITSPSEQLDVSGNILVTGAGSAGPHLKLAGAYTTWEIENQYAGGANNDMFRIRNTALGSDALVINRGNNKVGIGTTDPDQTLHVVGIGMIEDTSSTAYGTLQFGTNTSRYIRGNSAELQVGSTIQQLHFQNTSAAGQIASSAADGTDAIQILARTVHTSANILEVVNGNGAAPIFAIDYTGNVDISGHVGIGTESPQADLQVTGSGVFGTIGSNTPNSTVTVAGYDNFGLDFRAHGTWTHWKARVGHGRNFELYNDGTVNQRQVLELGKTTKDNASVYVRSTGAFIEAGMNAATSIPVVSMGCLADSDHLGGAYLDVRDAVASTHRYEFNRDGTFVASGVSVSGDVLGTGVGNRITNDGTPYLLSGDSPAETQTLQDVCDNGNETTTSIEVANGTIISGSAATTPAADLYVFGSGNADVINAVRERNDASIKVTSQTAGAYFRTNSATPTYNGIDLNTNWFIGQYGYNDLRIVDGTASAGDAAAAVTIQDSTKYVGIGTTNPDVILTVRKNDTVGPTIGLHNSEYQAWINSWGSTAAAGRQSRFEINAGATDFAAGATTIRFQTPNVGDSNERMRIDADGNVGIGTNAPITKLVVDTPMTRGQTNPSGLIVTDSANGAMALEMGVDRTSSASYIESRHTGSNTNYTLLLNPSYGKVGVGTTSPTSKFEVGTVAYGTNSIAKFWDGTDGVEITNRGASRQQIDFLGSNTSAINAKGSLFINYDSDNGGSNDTITFARNGVDEAGTVDMVITEGKVGIGTATITQGDVEIYKNGADAELCIHEDAGTHEARLHLRRGGSDWDIINNNQLAIETEGTEVFRITTVGNVGIGTSSPSNALDVVGHFSATSKSFLIDHPTKENKKLQYGSLEGPENGVYVRGTTDEETIELPEYWSELVHDESITVVLTPIGKKQDLFIIKKSNKLIKIGGVEGSFDYVVYGERKDIDKLEVEPLKV